MAFLPALLPSLSTLSTIASTAAAGVGALGTIAAANYQAKMNEFNAQQAEQNAKRAEERSQIEAQDNDMATLGMLGEQEAAQTASGVSLRSKSAVAVRRAARQLGRRDTLNIIQGGNIEAYNYRVQAVGERAQGQMAQMAGRTNALSSFLSLGGSLIGNAQSTKKGRQGYENYYGTPYDPYARKY